MKIEHIGIAVHNLEEAVRTYEVLLGTKCYKREKVESEQAETAFFNTGTSKVELLGSTGENSVLTRFLIRHGEGLHHIAFEVEDIRQEIARLKRSGYRVLNEVPRRGADNKLVAFVHPKDIHGVLIELCQAV